MLSGSDAENALTLARAAGDRPTVARALHVLGVVAQNEGDYERARTLLEEAAVLHRRTSTRCSPLARTASACSAWHQHDLTRAYGPAEEGLALHRAADSPGTVNSLVDLGLLAAVEQRYGDADSLLRESLALARAIAWNEIALASKASRRWPRVGASRHRRHDSSAPRVRSRSRSACHWSPPQEIHDGAEAAVRGALGDERFSELEPRSRDGARRAPRMTFGHPSVVGELPSAHLRFTDIEARRACSRSSATATATCSKSTNTVRDALARHRDVEVGHARGDAFFAAFAAPQRRRGGV